MILDRSWFGKRMKTAHGGAGQRRVCVLELGRGIAAEKMEDLRATLEQFAEIAGDLGIEG